MRNTIKDDRACKESGIFNSHNEETHQSKWIQKLGLTNQIIKSYSCIRMLKKWRYGKDKKIPYVYIGHPQVEEGRQKIFVEQQPKDFSLDERRTSVDLSSVNQSTSYKETYIRSLRLVRTSERDPRII